MADVGAAAGHAAAAARWPARILLQATRGTSRGQTSRLSTPIRCLSCCATRSRSVERRRPAPSRDTHPRRYCPWGTRPARRSSYVDLRARAHRPKGRPARPILRVRRTPTQPRSAIERRPTRSTQARRYARRGPPDAHHDPRGCSAVPPDDTTEHPRPAATKAPRRPSAWAEILGKQSVEDEGPPQRSASVTYAVAAAKVAKRSLLTTKRSIRKDPRLTSCAGPSPSAG